jgi:spore coat polysaccharide biosynthesis predicted glycosyltransferase SpsG
MPLLAIRADADGVIGAGHAMRCLTLAEAWHRAEYGRAVLWGRVEIPFVRQRAQRASVAIADEPPEHLDIMVIDSYDAAERSRAIDRFAGVRVVVDDLGWDGAESERLDVIWNPNAYGTAAMYPRAREVLTGVDAVPVRDGLPTWTRGDARRVLVSLGGGNAAGTLRDAVAALSARRPDLGFATTLPGIRGTSHVAPASLWDEATRAGVLVTSAGSTVWEAAAVGVPIVAIAIAPNQERVARYLRENSVPVVDAMKGPPAVSLADAVDQALPSAGCLPRLTNGAPRVARRLASLAQARS